MSVAIKFIGRVFPTCQKLKASLFARRVESMFVLHCRLLNSVKTVLLSRFSISSVFYDCGSTGITFSHQRSIELVWPINPDYLLKYVLDQNSASLALLGIIFMLPGIIAMMLMLYDTDIDGFIAMILMLYDTDIIGVIAMMFMLYDTDSDGIIHMITCCMIQILMALLP